MSFARRWFLGGSVALPAAAGASVPAKPSSAVEARLAKAIAEVRIFNTHEHLMPEKERIGQAVDFFTLAGHYAIADVYSAGLSVESMEAVNNPKTPMDQRWRLFEPHWRMARHTGYGQALATAIADIYGIGEISAASLARINQAMAKANKPGFYDYVLRDRARIDWCLVDAYWNTKPAALERKDFLLSQRFDSFITPNSRKDVEALEAISGTSIQSLADLKKAAEKTFELGIGAGMIAIKSGLAYQRELLFEEVAEPDAARDFEAMMKGGVAMPRGFRTQRQRVFRKLEDHMFHHVVRLADAHRLPVQIHTGLLAGYRCFLENTKPTLLANLFYLYPRVKFDIFHIGYPYQEELGVMAKLFQNVFVDFCWAHVISPPGSRRALDEYLETVPLNKILGFGGDYRYPELTYAHAKMARQNLVQVLAGKVEAGVFSEQSAVEAGTLILRDNAMQVFGIKG